MSERTLYLGCHLSAAKGWRAMGETALAIGANTFQFFTRNPRGGAMKALDENDANTLLALCREHAFGTLVAHAPYTFNPSSGEPKTRDFAYRCLPNRPCATFCKRNGAAVSSFRRGTSRRISPHCATG